MSELIDDFELIDELTHLNFSLERLIIEDHRPSQIYCVRFCDNIPSFSNYFCCVGANSLSIYVIDKLSNIKLVQSYIDQDNEEIFYSCTWLYNNKTNSLLVAIAGLRGTIKVINIIGFEIETVLLGHGNAVNDLRTHPIDDNLILSASKDESIRLWNVNTSICIAIFGGDKGHRDEILCIDIHLIGNCFISAGMDTSIKIWSLEDPNVINSIEESNHFSRTASKSPFKSVSIQCPLFSTTQVHNDYVDSIRWVGNCILSKSTKNRVVLWAPDVDRYKGAPLILREYAIVDSNLWYVRMDVCIPLDIFAVGNKDGKVFVYRLSSDIENNSNDPNANDHIDILDDQSTFNSINSNNNKKPLKIEIKENFESDSPQQASVTLSHNKSKSTVRQVAFDVEGKYVAYGCDDGTISLWRIHSS